MANERKRAGRTPSPAARRITMSDVAREAGCSQSTVSFVLNENASVSISPQTRLRVVEVARAMGYARPHMPALAKAGRPAGFRKIALMIDSLSTSPEGIVAVSGIREALEGEDTVLLIVETGNDPVLEPATVEMLIADGVSAIVYACIFTRTVDLPPPLRTAPVPVLLLNCTTGSSRHHCVVPGEVDGGRRATRALLDAGHRRIGTIMGEAFMSAATDRLEGYRRALAGAGLPFDPDLVVDGDWSASAGYRGTDRLMALPGPPTAIFCQNDRMAIGCYEYLKERGMVIARDVSVVGYDDEEIARHLSPPLTTLVLPHRRMGQWVVERLRADPAGTGACKMQVSLECQLVERSSVGRVAGATRKPAMGRAEPDDIGTHVGKSGGAPGG